MLHEQHSVQFLREVPEDPADHTYGMTNDELRSFILDRLAPSLDQAWRERDTLAERAEASRQDAEREREARRKAEKEAADRKKTNVRTSSAAQAERHVIQWTGTSTRTGTTAVRKRNTMTVQLTCCHLPRVLLRSGVGKYRLRRLDAVVLIGIMLKEFKSQLKF